MSERQLWKNRRKRYGACGGLVTQRGLEPRTFALKVLSRVFFIVLQCSVTR